MFNKAKFYFEWIYIIKYYFKSINKPVRRFEIYMPLFISVTYAIIYLKNNQLKLALDNFSSILPNVLSILIGFTITILMIMPSITEKIEKIKKNRDDKLNPFLQLLSQFSFNVFSELILLCLIFVYMSFSGFKINMSIYILFAFFIIELFLLLNILFSTIRGITNIFLLFSSLEKKK
ncbi:hypothetical protein F300043A5_19920 [Massilimicrobiota timonensis]